jgi:hypothetical protein
MRQISNRHLMFALILSAILLIPIISVKANQSTQGVNRNIAERQVGAFNSVNEAEVFCISLKL